MYNIYNICIPKILNLIQGSSFIVILSELKKKLRSNVQILAKFVKITKLVKMFTAKA